MAGALFHLPADGRHFEPWGCTDVHGWRGRTEDKMTRPIESWRDTYSPAELAQKYGLTIDQARVVISSNGPSRHGCEMGAQAFGLALKMRNGRAPSRLPSSLPRNP